MPQTLERIPRMLRRVVSGYGRELPHIVAYNENHDELGRFAEGDSAGGTSSSGIKDIAQKIQDVVEKSKTRSEMASKLKEMATKAKEDIKNHVVSAIEKTKSELTAYPESVREGLGRDLAQHGKDFARDLIDQVNHEARYTITQLRGKESRDQIKETLGSTHEELGPAGVQSHFDFNAGYLREAATARFTPITRSPADARRLGNEVVSRLARNLGLSNVSASAIVAYNENHDELGRFAESDSSAANASAAAKTQDKHAERASLAAFVGRDAAAHRAAATALKEAAKLHEAAAKAHDAASAAATGKTGIGGEVEHRVNALIHRESARANKSLANAHKKRARYLDAVTP